MSSSPAAVAGSGEEGEVRGELRAVRQQLQAQVPVVGQGHTRHRHKRTDSGSALYVCQEAGGPSTEPFLIVTLRQADQLQEKDTAIAQVSPSDAQAWRGGVYIG